MKRGALGLLLVLGLPSLVPGCGDAKIRRPSEGAAGEAGSGASDDVDQYPDGVQPLATCLQAQ